MSLPTRVRLVIVGIFMSIIFVLNECKKLDGYNFPVYSTQFCPRNESEWNKRSSALNCNKTNGYTCLPNEKLTELLEFCYIRPWIWIEKGFCLYLEKKGSYVDSYNCNHFIQGCHNTSYQSRRIFEYPACISIGNGCFLAEQSCKSSPNTTHRPQATENNKDDWLWVLIVIGIVVVFLCVLSCMLYFYRKKRKLHRSKRGTDIERNGKLEEEKSLIANTEKNENFDCSDKESPFDKAIFEQWDQENKWFISSNACSEVEKKTAEQSLVIVTGHSGSGKSAIIQHVALKYRKNGWIVKPVKNIKDIADSPLIRNDLTKILFVFNDPLGKESLDELLYNEWQRYEEALPSYLKRAKLLMSCRKTILSDTEVNGLFRDVSNVVDINIDLYKLKEDEKRNILKSYKIDEKFSEEECAVIVQIEEYFPLLCKLYSEKDGREMEGINFFKEPDRVLAKEIRGLRNTKKKGKYCALILLILFNNELCVSDITENKVAAEKFEHALNLCGMDKTAAYSIKDELESLIGYLVKKIEDTYQFYHDFVMEVTTFIVGTDYPKTVIKYADLGFLRTRVRYGKGNDISEKFTIYLSDRHIDELGERLFSDIFGERLLDVVLNPCLRNESMKKVFEEKLKNNSEKRQMLLEKVELQTDKQKLHQTSTNLHLSKLAFVHLENEVSTLFALIVFGDTDLSLQCLKTLQEPKINLTGCSLFPAVCCNGSVELFDWFLKNNSDCLTEKWGGLSPIHIVTVFHNSEILKKLINETTIDVNLMIDKINEPNPLIIPTEKDTGINTGQKKENSNKKQTNKRKFLISNKEDINPCLKDEISSLHIACFDGYNNIVQILLSNGAKINLCTEKGASPLYITCLNGHESTVQLLLSNGANINLCEKEGASPLYIACQNGHESTVQLLLSNGANINLCEEEGASPLYIACQNGHESIVQLLLSNEANINLCMEDGTSPLTAACFDGHDSTVQLLLRNGADINLCKKNGAGPLYIACQNGHDSTVQLLLSNGANINLCEEDGASPLYIACQNGHESTVQLLLSNGANINLCEAEGASPLFIACQNEHDSTVQLLLSNGANINLCVEEGASPLYIACQNGHESTVQLLLSNGANINLCKKNGAGPLYIACKNGHDSTVQLLLSNGANINLCKKNGAGPLYIACQNGHESTVQLLLSNGANINLCMENGVGPLYKACKNGHDSTVQLLLSNGANINLCEEEGASPLYIACQNGHESTVQLLLRNGADINLCKKNGADPLYIACQNGHDSTVQL